MRHGNYHVSINKYIYLYIYVTYACNMCISSANYFYLFLALLWTEKGGKLQKTGEYECFSFSRGYFFPLDLSWEVVFNFLHGAAHKLFRIYFLPAQMLVADLFMCSRADWRKQRDKLSGEINARR